MRKDLTTRDLDVLEVLIGAAGGNGAPVGMTAKEIAQKLGGLTTRNVLNSMLNLEDTQLVRSHGSGKTQPRQFTITEAGKAYYCRRRAA